MGFLAPAGTRLSPFDVATDLVAGGLRADQSARFASLLASHSRRDHAWLMSSGRAAMVLVLQAMKDVAGARRDEVLIPGYTCYSVPAAIRLAGLTPRLCDVNPSTLGIDPDAARDNLSDRTLAMVSANLYGMPNDLSRLETLARSQGVFMLDDAAQALGASADGRPVGGFGDTGIYSFDKGKNITCIQGGAIVARGGALAEAIARRVETLPRTGHVHAATLAAKLLVYALLLPPAAYGMTRRIPGLGLGSTPFELDFPRTRLAPMLVPALLSQWAALEGISSARISKASRMETALTGISWLQSIARNPRDVSVFPRLPMLCADAVARDRAIALLAQAGIGATASYPRALADVPEVRRMLRTDPGGQDGARSIAQRILTLPTHGYCPDDLGARIRVILEEHR